MLAAVTLAALLALPTASSEPPIQAKREGMPYPLPTCIVSGEPLGADTVTLILENQKSGADNGRELKFCCSKCVERFQANPGDYLPKFNAEIVKQQLAWYPAVSCPVMPDEKLPMPGQPGADEVKNVVYKNRLVRLCCAKCVRRFNANPEQFLKLLDESIIAASSGSYPLSTCPISGKPLGEGAQNVIAANRLVKVCCRGCIAAVDNDPMKYAEMVSKAPAKPAPN